MRKEECAGVLEQSFNGASISIGCSWGDVPLDSFFDDEFFTLIYTHSGDLSEGLQLIREQLRLVSNKRVARSKRAAAALFLGMSVIGRAASRDALVSDDRARAIRWLELGRQLNCVIACRELASLRLSEFELELRTDFADESLPWVVFGRTGLPVDDWKPTMQLHATWYCGARLALRHVQRGFAGWREEHFDAAFTSILCYVAYTPRWRMEQIGEPIVERVDVAMAWINPLWTRLSRAAAGLYEDPDAYVTKKYEQLQAARLVKEGNRDNFTACSKTADNLEPKSHVTRAHQMVVIRSEIPPSSERSENTYLRRFEALQQPVSLTLMPRMDELFLLEQTLRREFPWADDAVDVVMSELLARRRHGVVILNMTPLLLVGVPGNGKTRFARRVSELLRTPNTIINLAGMTDVKLLKGLARGWSSNRPSRILEFMLQTRCANPLFILDEIDKTSRGGVGGDPEDALLDLLEPGNSSRYQDIYLMAECDLSRAMYIATSNSLERIPAPLLSRLRLAHFPPPGPEHSAVIMWGILRDLEVDWQIPEGSLNLTQQQQKQLVGLPARQMRHALLDILGGRDNASCFTLH